LKREPDTEVEVVDGNRGELTVLADGRVVARKEETLPTVDEVLAAVQKAQPAGAGA
jgi:hypothetical protein